MTGQTSASRLLIGAAHKSSGKTTVSIGIGRAFAERGLAVQPFKKGPDYIDPMWLARAAGRACYNLDFNTQSAPEIQSTLTRRSHNADIALIEANKGLYDGVDLEGSDSNAALAKLLGVPVFLVIDAEGITRGIAPLLLGYCAFDPAVWIAGVILNKVAGSRHEGKLRAAVERYSDLPVLGCLRRDADLTVRERHIGLTTPAETGEVEALIARTAAAVRDGVDLDRVHALAAQARPFRHPSITMAAPAATSNAVRVRIAVARDAAFGFYYPDDLLALENAGAELLFFDALKDHRLPDADGLLIGGGFPETHLARLEANTALRANIRSAIENGLPCYAECGGLMYLCRSIEFGGERRAMVGVIPGDAVMCATPQGRGQVQLEESAVAPWPVIEGAGGAGWRTNAHEFHFAALRNLPAHLDYAFNMIRGDGIDGRQDGIVLYKMLATFSHQRDTQRNPWSQRFVAFVRQCLSAKGVVSLSGPAATRQRPSLPARATCPQKEFRS